MPQGLTSKVGEVGLERLLQRLDDADWRVRQSATDELIAGGDVETTAAVVRAMRHKHQSLPALNSAIRVLARGDTDVLAPLVEFLSDSDAQLRIAAALTLGERRDARAIPALVGALGDSDANVRYHAIEALGKLRAAESVEALVSTAQSRDFSLAAPALEALAAIGDSSVAMRLMPLLHDDFLQPAMLELLGRVGDQATAQMLTDMLSRRTAPAADVAGALAAIYGRHETDFGRGGSIAEAVASSATPAAVDALIAATARATASEWQSLVLIMGWLNDDRVARPLIEALARPEVRAQAIDAIVSQGARMTTILNDQLAGGDLEMRQAAAIAAGRIKDSHSVPRLLTLVNGGDELALAAIAALAMIGDLSACRPLLDLAGHGDTRIREAVIAALDTLNHPDMPGHLAGLLVNARPIVRESAIYIAGNARAAGCADLILERCRDDEVNVRAAAFRALALMQDARVLPLLDDALQAGDAELRTAAARALGQIEGSAGWPPLRLALEDPDPWVRYFAARSIGQQKHCQAAPVLRQILERDAAMQVRIAAVDTLGKLGDEEAEEILACMAHGPDPHLANAARAALGEIACRDARAALRTSHPSEEES